MLNANAMGIIFPNVYDSLVPELTSDRLMASVPFAGRYRLIDFLLSNMTNSGIDNIAFLVRSNYHSLLDHLGAGREWDLVRKNGGITVFPPYASKNSGVTNDRITGLSSIMPFIKDQKEKYVILSDTNYAANIDLKKLVETHEKSGADITVAYKKQEVPANLRMTDNYSKGFYYTLYMDENSRVIEMNINPREEGVKNYSLNLYVMNRELLIDMVDKSFLVGGTYFERDLIRPNTSKIKVMGYEIKDYVARITGMKSYFDENMKLLDDENLDALFGPNPIYTKIRDDNPTRYVNGSKAKNVLVADGCVIEGEVENSILFRGVKIGKGAKVKNCILFQDTVVGDGANLEYVITDKGVTVSKDKELKGADSFPLYIAKGKYI